LHASGMLLDPGLIDFRATWAVCPEAVDRAERLGLVSYEWVLCCVAHRLALAVRPWSEVLSWWTRSPENPGLRYAIVHPRKRKRPVNRVLAGRGSFGGFPPETLSWRGTSGT
jgi:hypothetical protein